MAFSAIYDLVVDERDIRIYSNGTGAPVLMLPDLGSSAATWECLTGRVCEQDRQIVAIDLPGTGHSDPVRGSDLAAFVEHLQSVVEQLGRDPIDLVGCGFGGYLVASLAAREPSLVRRLILENPSLPPRSGPPVRSRMAPSMAISGAVTTLRRGRIKQNVLGFSRAKAVLDQLARADPSWWAALAQITAPTLVIGSGSTEVADRALLDLLAGAIPGAVRADLPTGRRGHGQDPDGFAAAMMPFLAA
ncbi:MAG: alpha/beta fold hydrolase [Nakamurella sp.]